MDLRAVTSTSLRARDSVRSVASSKREPVHIVQFYDDEEFLAATVADFLARGLIAGQPSLVIATKPHVDAFMDRLRAQGLPLDAARRERRFTCLDARETLASFMSGAMPDAQRFKQTIGGSIQKSLSGGYSTLYAYGEMVDLLWRDGNHDAAIRLEELWNELAREHSFTLLCAYPMGNFSTEAHSKTFETICGQHDRVIPTEQYTTAAAERRSVEISLLQQKARSLETEVGKRRDVELELRAAIEDRDRVEQDLQRLAAIVRSSDDAIVSKNLDGIITSWNRAAERMFGYTPEQAIGKSIRMIIPPDRQSEEDRVLDRIRRGEMVDHFDTIRLRRDGSEVAISLTVSPIRNARGEIVGASKVARDISDRRRIEQERQRLLELEQAGRAEAERANRAKDEFLTVLSHELRTPLNAILGWTRIATSQDSHHKTNPTLRRAFDVIERNASLQLHLIDDLLDVSRIVTGKMRITSEPVDLIGVLGSVVESLRPAAAAKAIDLDIHIEESSLIVLGDAARLQQIAWNVVSNAIKFTADAGRVQLRLERAATAVRIIVQDSGEGITSDFLPHIFDRFRQADGTTTRKHGGLGLGLAVTRYLVEAHGGAITAQSAGKGLGSVFTISLPIVQSSNGSSHSAVASDSAVRLDGVRLLVIDDDEDARFLLRCMLEHRGADVTSAQSGDEALSQLEAKPFDAVLADLGMPGQDGYTLIQRIRREAPLHVRQISAVAVTAYAGDAHRTKAIASGFNDYLVKPVAINRLARVITGLLASKEASAKSTSS